MEREFRLDGSVRILLPPPNRYFALLNQVDIRWTISFKIRRYLSVRWTRGAHNGRAPPTALLHQECAQRLSMHCGLLRSFLSHYCFYWLVSSLWACDRCTQLSFRLCSAGIARISWFCRETHQAEYIRNWWVNQLVLLILAWIRGLVSWTIDAAAVLRMCCSSLLDYCLLWRTASWFTWSYASFRIVSKMGRWSERC